MDTSKDLYTNVVFSGGNSMFPRFGVGMAQKFTSLAPSTMNIRVRIPPITHVFVEDLWICSVFP